MMIYGRNAVMEALRGGEVERIFIARGVKASTIEPLERLAAAADVPIDHVPRIELDQRLKTTHHQGVAAELPELAYSEPDAPFRLAEAREERLLLILLDQLTDPRNYGAIIRSAEVLGAHGVVTEARRSAPLSPVVAKAAAGATSHLPLVQVTNLPRYIAELKERNVWVYGADGSAERAPWDIDWVRDAALVIGSEGSGLRRLVRETCDELVRIPMRGRIASLNAAVAAGILVHEVVRGRQRST
jgi:23S rRNA (guanosine2251-2'-O)-methyltransferase